MGNDDLTPASDTVTVLQNDPPNKPSTPSGPTTVRVGSPATYSSSATDDDGDKIKLGWDWDGDNVVDDWTGYVDSGTTVSFTHTWNTQDTYTVKVIAEDLPGVQGPWSDPITVTVPRSRNVNSLFQILLERFPNAFPLLQQIQGL